MEIILRLPHIQGTGSYASHQFFLLKTHVLIWLCHTSCGILVTLKVKEIINAQDYLILFSVCLPH